MKTKKELRKEILKIRDRMPQEERKTNSHKIAMQVIKRKEFLAADKILLFASYKSEVDTTEMFEIAKGLGKTIYYPKVEDGEMNFYQVESLLELKCGYRGIYEPEANQNKKFCLRSTDKIFALMPGAVFDNAHHRIGYGGGYYDKFLHKLNGNIYTVAVTFECQLVEVGVIPQEVHDIKPDIIITEERNL